MSWSLIDYDGVAKASYYAVARAFAPVVASFRRDGDRVELWITNDRLERVRDEAGIALVRLDGGVAWNLAVALDVAANASACVWHGAVEEARDRILTVRSTGGVFPANRLLPAPVKDLALDPDPGLTMTCEPGERALRITLSATRYALGVALRSDDPGLRFTDNHFDLAGGERHGVTITHASNAPVSPDAIAVSVWNRGPSR